MHCKTSALYRGPTQEGSTMEATSGQVRVTERGQMSLPAQARHRWGLHGGGEVGWIDLGDAMLLFPGGIDRARSALLETLEESDWQEAAAGFGDPDLANQ